MSEMERTIQTCRSLDTLYWWQDHFNGLLRKVNARIEEMETEQAGKRDGTRAHTDVAATGLGRTDVPEPGALAGDARGVDGARNE